MPDFWRAKVTVQNVTRTPTNLDPLPAGFQDVDDSFLVESLTGPRYGFGIIDYDPHPVLSGETRFYITIGVASNGHFLPLPSTAREWQVTETFTWVDRGSNTSAEFATFQTSDGSNGAAYLGNANLKIEKDIANAKYIVTGLLGSADLLFSALPLGATTLSTARREFAGYRLDMADSDLWYPSPTFFHPFKFTYVQGSGSVEFSQFYTYKNDMVAPRRGATLGTGDRGHWVNPPVPPLTDEFGNLYLTGFNPWWLRDPGSAYSWTSLNADLSAAIEAGVTGGTNLSTDTAAAETRYWDLNRFFPIPGTLIDMVHAREHGAHLLAYILVGSETTVKWARSHDKIRTVTDGDIYTGGTNASPNIAWAFGKAYAIWENVGSILRAISSDFGQTWGTPVFIATGTNCRLLTEPETGFSLLFYIDGSNLKVLRSGNFFVDLVETPAITVATIDAQTVAAQFALDGSVIVSYQSGGSILTLRSSDYGRTYS